MRRIINKLFGKSEPVKESSDPVKENSVFQYSISMDRNKTNHTQNMNLVIDMLNEQNIIWNTFESDASAVSIYDKYRYKRFNISVNIKDKEKLEHIIKEVYGY